jgi:hypothetical protein
MYGLERQAWLGWVLRGSSLSGPAGMVWYVVARKGAIRQVWQGYVQHFNVLRTNARLQPTALRIRPEGLFNFFRVYRRRGSTTRRQMKNKQNKGTNK